MLCAFAFVAIGASSALAAGIEVDAIFDSTAIAVNGTTNVTMLLYNRTGSVITHGSFSETDLPPLPVGLVFTDPPNLDGCDFSFSPLSNGASCTGFGTVTSASAGHYDWTGSNTGTDYTFTMGSGAQLASLDVYDAPTVTSISPTTGPTAGGTSVTITGTNLTGATSVNFGSEAATEVTVVDATTVTATAPSGTAGGVDVTVTTPIPARLRPGRCRGAVSRSAPMPAGRSAIR